MYKKCLKLLAKFVDAGIIRPPQDLTIIRRCGSLAQLVEQLAFNQLVARSNRARPTILYSKPFPVSLFGSFPPTPGLGT